MSGMGLGVLTRDRLKMLDQRRGRENRSNPGPPVREGRRAAKSYRVVLERRPFDSQHIAAGIFERAAQFMREVSFAAGSPFNGVRERGFKLAFPSRRDGQLRELDDHAFGSWPGIHDVPASGTLAMAAASTVSATKSSFSKWCTSCLPQARAMVVSSIFTVFK